jgi:hypothetical protein
MLHIADAIEWSGPVWTAWAYPMERFCGKVNRAVKARRHHYASIDRYVLHTAQLDHIRFRYGLDANFGLNIRSPKAGVEYAGEGNFCSPCEAELS